jgi:bacterioferritin-associated ferredoxin
MFVCICHAVTETDVESQISAGARTKEEIGERCRAGTGCGRCTERICAMLAGTSANLERQTLAVA